MAIEQSHSKATVFHCCAPSVMDEYANILLSQCKLFGVPNSAIEGIGIPNSAIEGSNILNETYCKTLHGWLREDGSDGKFELLYQSSRDGISANNFHSKCDGKGSTITVIETKVGPSLGLVLGGYSPGHNGKIMWLPHLLMDSLVHLCGILQFEHFFSY